MTTKLVNKRGWWGILLHASWVTIAAVIITAVIYGIVLDAASAWSAALGGGVVWVLSAITILVIALIWKNFRNIAISITMGAFVAKIVILGLLLTVVPTPDWLQTNPTAIGALVSIVVWQFSEIIVFMKTRRLIYEN